MGPDLTLACLLTATGLMEGRSAAWPGLLLSLLTPTTPTPGGRPMSDDGLVSGPDGRADDDDDEPGPDEPDPAEDLT